jgi:hypothetical protein
VDRRQPPRQHRHRHHRRRDCRRPAAAVASRSFRIEGFRDTPDLVRHLAGAALMGFGGVTALGCTIGQGLSGLSTLSAAPPSPSPASSPAPPSPSRSS